MTRGHSPIPSNHFIHPASRLARRRASKVVDAQPGIHSDGTPSVMPPSHLIVLPVSMPIAPAPRARIQGQPIAPEPPERHAELAVHEVQLGINERCRTPREADDESSEQPLQEHEVQPTAELEADLPKMRDARESEPLVKHQRACVVGIDTRDHETCLPSRAARSTSSRISAVPTPCPRIPARTCTVCSTVKR